ncbi:DUF4397 domain-containing protein [Nocardioides zeicaulis]|uniref:DUF4397 domain-containing protein n=1 Tax=Nocardioides zeicaulis TaxID=1776857 RepID=A0ABV6DX63_9ACTN
MRTPVLTATAASLAALVLTAAPVAPAASSGPAAAPGLVTLVQAVPDAAVSIEVDGRSVARNAAVGDVLGPLGLTPGRHAVVFTGADFTVDSSLEVSSGRASDVVLHLPAEVDGEPVVHSYAAPTGPIGPGKARVLLAHTATVPPADVQVDGETVFTNIANGEFADADVPAGPVEVALLPSGGSADPILGPLDLTLEPRTLSMVYAYGNPSDGSMSVISHTEALSDDGSVVPTRIDTGTAGLARGHVTTFAGDAPPATVGDRPGVPADGTAPTSWQWAEWLGLVATAGAAVLVGRHARRVAG